MGEQVFAREALEARAEQRLKLRVSIAQSVDLACDVHAPVDGEAFRTEKMRLGRARRRCVAADRLPEQTLELEQLGGHALALRHSRSMPCAISASKRRRWSSGTASSHSTIAGAGPKRAS